MKFLRIAVATVFAFAFGSASAFHSGGVAECEGCHSMHNSFEGSANVSGQAQYLGGPFLLKARDQSGACLNCHQGPRDRPSSYHVSTPGITDHNHTAYPENFSPGGDFAWLKKTMDTTIRGTVTVNGNDGDRHGHNIVAIDFGYTSDSTLGTAPGGTFVASNLACSSCHDPHGKYRRTAEGTQVTTGLPTWTSGSYNNANVPVSNQTAVGVYRILAGVGYAPKSYSPGAFANPAPDAVVSGNYNVANTTIAGSGDRVAYGRGMSEWCANCHGGIILNGTYTSGMAGLRHPAGVNGKLTGAVVANYSAYISSGIMTGPGPMNGYSALAPFELGVTDSTLASYVTLKAFQTGPSAPTTSNNVLCLSCHRAHASGFESMTRFSTINEFMTINNSTGGGLWDVSTTENKINFGYDSVGQTNAYLGRDAALFGNAARNYCNKCHAKD